MVCYVQNPEFSKSSACLLASPTIFQLFILGEVSSENQLLMTELLKCGLESLYPAFVKNGVKAGAVWSLKKTQLDEMNVPYYLMKKYLQKLPISGSEM